MIRFRIDVDYPFTSRTRSFLYVMLGVRTSSDYLGNSKIISKMINDSNVETKAFWFFTVKTLPDQELLELLNDDKHEIALHVVKNPTQELMKIESATGRRVNYYTIHGTARLTARIMWKRWRSNRPKIPMDFPLRSFHEFPTTGIDSLCYSHSTDEAFRIAAEQIRKGDVIYFHPIWLFQRGKINHRGPYYEVLRRILELEQ